MLVHTAEALVKKEEHDPLEILLFVFCSYKARQPIWLTLLPSSCFTLSLFPLAAIYLCKRTMQNKARLELADYEAVSTLSFCFLVIVGKLSVQCHHCVWTILWWQSVFPVFYHFAEKQKRFPLGAWKCPNPFFPAKSHYRITDFYTNLLVIFLFQEPHLAEYNTVIYWPQYISKRIYRSTWH